MADIAPNSGEAALSLAATLADHNGGDVVVLDVSAQAGWTDRFVIATATSLAHLRGLARFIDEELPAWASQRLRRGSSLADDDEWLLIDLGGDNRACDDRARKVVLRAREALVPIARGSRRSLRALVSDLTIASR